MADTPITTTHVCICIISILLCYIYQHHERLPSTVDNMLQIPAATILSNPSSPPFYKAPSKRQLLVNSDKLLFNLPRLDFAIVSDLDTKSRDPNKFLWRSHFKRGTLVRKASVADQFEIQWSNETLLESRTSYRNRSMELSELVRYDHLLLAMCDITGLVFKIKLSKLNNQKPQVFQRWALADSRGLLL